MVSGAAGLLRCRHRLPRRLRRRHRRLSAADAGCCSYRHGRAVRWFGGAGRIPVGLRPTVSRTNYPGLFAVINTTYGAGDGSTTFNAPDLRGRVAAGKDNGGAAVNRITNGGSGISGTALGAAGGTEIESAGVSVGVSVSGSLSGTAHGYLGGTIGDADGNSGRCLFSLM